MEPKLTILFMLIGSIITLSHLGAFPGEVETGSPSGNATKQKLGGTFARLRQQMTGRGWRNLMSALRKF